MSERFCENLYLFSFGIADNYNVFVTTIFHYNL